MPMLQVQKLRHKEVKKLTKITQMISGGARVVFLPRPPFVQGFFFHLFLLLSAFDHMFLGESILFNKPV